MKRLLAVLIDRPIGVSLLLAVVAILGGVSLWRIPLSAMPSIIRPVIRAEAAVTGVGLDQLEAGLARDLEERLMSLPGIDAVTVWCKDGGVVAEAAYRWGVEEEKARLRVAEAVEDLSNGGQPLSWQVTVTDPLARPALLLTIEGGLPMEQRSLLAEEVLMPQFAALPGIGRIEVLGGLRERTLVRPDPAKMALMGITAGTLRSVLVDGVANRTLGEVRLEGERLEVVAAGHGDQPAGIAALPVPHSGGTTVALRDIASVAAGPWAEHGILLIAGRPAVGLALYLVHGANVIDVGRQVDRTLGAIEAKMPVGTHVVRVVDEAAELRSALLGLLFAALLGTLFEGLILILFVRRPGPLVILIAVTPLCLLASLPVFEALGLDLNLVSLAGVSLALGMLVDASVVVMDSVLRRHGDARARAVEGTAEVARAILASVVTTAVVFLPALYLRHLAAALFRELAIAIMVTLMVSLCFALLAVPVAASALSPEKRAGEPGFTRRYRRLLTRLMTDGRWTMPAVGGCLVLLFALYPSLPQHLLPPESRTASEVSFTLPPPSDPPHLEAIRRALQPSLASARIEREADILVLGQNPRSGPPLSTGYWRLPETRGMEALERIRGEFTRAVPAMTVSRVGPVGGVLDALPLRLLTVDVSGPRREVLDDEVLRLEKRFREAGIAVLADLPSSIPRIVYVPTPLGLREGPGLGDHLAGILPLPDPVEVGALRLVEPLPTLAALEGISITTGDGRTVPMGSLAEFRTLRQPPVKVRHQGEAAVRLLVGDITGEVRGIERTLDSLKQSAAPGTSLRASGGILDWQEARRELKLAMLLGLLLIFLVMIATYESLRMTLVVFSILPFALLGGVLALLAAGQGLDLASGLGFLLLCGLAVNNGILLVDQLTHCPGGPSRWAMRASHRLRPVLVTTLTTLATLGPVALMGGTGASLRATLALTVFSGLLLSTLAALFICPPLARIALRRTTAPDGSLPEDRLR